jgi:methylenetetrahydrofolate--tRNA-(uracil-5-)-methyltransferase
MNVNFGLFPGIDDFEKTDPETGRRYRGKEKGRAKKRAQSSRALTEIDAWLGQQL